MTRTRRAFLGSVAAIRMGRGLGNVRKTLHGFIKANVADDALFVHR